MRYLDDCFVVIYFEEILLSLYMDENKPLKIFYWYCIYLENFTWSRFLCNLIIYQRLWTYLLTVLSNIITLWGLLVVVWGTTNYNGTSYDFKEHTF